MKKRILALLLAVTIISSPVAYADENISETMEATAQNTGIAEVIEDTNPDTPVGNTGDTSGADASENENAVISGLSNTEAQSEEPDSQSENPTENEENQTEDETTEEKPVPTDEVDPDKYDLPEEATPITEMTLSEPVETLGGDSGKTITISSIELGEMPTNGYYYLSFTFSNEEDGTLYEGYLAGITVYPVEQEGNEKTSDERIVNLVAAIADRYYAGEAISLCDEKAFAEKYGLVVRSIDAEKIANADYTPDTEDQDTNLCWAASASNMIEFTDWNDEVDENLNLINEDAIFDYFANSYTDKGLTQEYGLKWFINGVNPEEDSENGDIAYFNNIDENGVVHHNCYDSDGNLKYYYTLTQVTEQAVIANYYNSDNQAVYYYVENEETGDRVYCTPDNQLIFKYISGNFYDADGNILENPGLKYGVENGFAQEKIKSTGTEGQVDTKNGNLLSDYAEETLSDITFLFEGGSYDGLYESVMELKDQVATGLAVYFIKDAKLMGAHAVTVFGYIKDALSDGWQSLKALFITDSDNDKDVTTTRAGAIDRVNMYEVEAETTTSSVYSGSALLLKNYYQDSYEVPILGYTTLKPASYATLIETKGTKDSVNTVDYSVVNLVVVDEDGTVIDTFNVGDTVYLYTDLQNRSYKSLDDYSSPYFVLSYDIKCDGEDQGPCVIVAYANTNSYAFTDCIAAPKITFDKVGNYTITVSIEGIYYDDENGNPVKIQEAYYTNNNYMKTYSFTVESGIEPEEYTPVKVNSIPTITKTIKATAQGSCVINLTELNGEVVTVKLGGETLGLDDYAITYNADGTATIVFSETFMSSLLPGVYSFSLLDASANVLAIIKLTIM